MEVKLGKNMQNSYEKQLRPDLLSRLTPEHPSDTKSFGDSFSSTNRGGMRDTESPGSRKRGRNQIFISNKTHPSSSAIPLSACFSGRCGSPLPFALSSAPTSKIAKIETGEGRSASHSVNIKMSNLNFSSAKSCSIDPLPKARLRKSPATKRKKLNPSCIVLTPGSGLRGLRIYQDSVSGLVDSSFVFDSLQERLGMDLSNMRLITNAGVSVSVHENVQLPPAVVLHLIPHFSGRNTNVFSYLGHPRFT